MEPRISGKCILVLGMHRSGTSALTQLISQIGASLPKNPVPAGAANVKGHWEPQDLVNFNERILAELNSRWHDCRHLDLTQLSADRYSYYRQVIVQGVLAEYAESPLFVLKDPRICRLMPLWRDALEEITADLSCVIIVRHPFEVALSLGERNRLPFQYACLLWLRHVLEAERETRAIRRLFVTYEALISDPEEISVRIETEILGKSYGFGKNHQESIGSHIDSQLRHHAASFEDFSDQLANREWLGETLEALSRLTINSADANAQGILDAVRGEVDAAMEPLAAMLSEVDQALATWRTQVALLERDAGEAEKLRVEQRTQQQARLAEQREFQRQIARMESVVRAMTNSTSWRLTQPLRALGQIFRNSDD